VDEKKEEKQAKKLALREKEKQKPKRVRPAFTFFVQEQMPLVKNQTTPVTEAIKKISAKWKELTPQQKEAFQEKSHKDVERKDREMQKYLVKYPKRPLSNYNKFIATVFPQLKSANPNLKTPDLMKEAARQWRASAQPRV